MARSKWKGKVIFLKYINSYFITRPILTARDMILLYSNQKESIFLPQLCGRTIWVYNGKEWFKVFIILDIIFHQFGAFVWPKKRCFFKKNKKKKKGK
jgi:ribosomal protein S19